MKQIRNIFAAMVLATAIISGCSDDDGVPVAPGTTSNIVTHADVKLSAQGNTIYGNLYDADRDSTFRVQFYGRERALTELIYFYDVTDGSVLASPVLPKLTSVMNYSGYITGDKGVGAHSSRLKKLDNFTAGQFDALTDSTALKGAYLSVNTTDDQVTNLAPNDVVGFLTSEGRMALLKVVSIDGNGGASSITFTVKTQQ